MTNLVSIETGAATKTSTGVDGGIDVCFDATLDDGTVLSGEVTLLPREDGSPEYGAWGAPNNWLDGRTLAALRGLDGQDFTDALNMIEQSTGCTAEDYAESEANKEGVEQFGNSMTELES